MPKYFVTQGDESEGTERVYRIEASSPEEAVMKAEELDTKALYDDIWDDDKVTVQEMTHLDLFLDEKITEALAQAGEIERSLGKNKLSS